MSQKPGEESATASILLRSEVRGRKANNGFVDTEAAGDFDKSRFRGGV